jgi:adenine phosphoribosyltransferase
LADLDAARKTVEALIRDVHDYPQEGIVFKDLTPVLAAPEALEQGVQAIIDPYRDAAIDRVVGIEARGFLFAVPAALELGAGFVPARKPGKLPHETVSVSYALEYGTGSLEMHVDAIEKGQRVLIVDDLLATGGTADAARQLVIAAGAEVVGFSFLVELDFLAGRRRLDGARIESLVHF